MSFDASRFSFHPFNDYLGVVMQQGRVQLDADWNEWVAELSRRLQAGTLDTVGRAVVPRTTPNGFQILADSGALTIGVGRIYVDGLLAENHGVAPLAWDEGMGEEVGTLPVPFVDQPYLPFNEEGEEAGAAIFDAPELSGGPHLVYLDVWQREVTHLQETGLIEPAVGVDTTGRLQTVWQVKVLPDIGDAGCFSPDGDIEGWAKTIQPSGARLSSSTSETDGESNPCLAPPGIGYTGLENQLYRVEIHGGGDQDEATFKWSRDNGTVAARVLEIHDGRRLVVDNLGRDDVLSFHAGDWIEILDDWHELHGIPGRLHRIAAGDGIDKATRSITLQVAISPELFPVDNDNATYPDRHTRIRRWDQRGIVRLADGSVYHDLTGSAVSDGIPVPPTGTSLVLESGIVVEFTTADDGEFHTGDNWVFAARAGSGKIEELVEAPPRGIHHHYARLAIVTMPESETNCRVLWPPEVVSGEGCGCTACVYPEAHNSGASTIQHAIDNVRARGGGTICLDIGVYLLEKPLNMENVRSLQFRGKGWKTMLRPIDSGQVINVAQAIGVRIEDMSIQGAVQSGTASLIDIHNSAEVHLCGLTMLATASGRATAAAIGISGIILSATIEDCICFAERGLIVKPGKKEYLLTADLRVANNVFLCSEAGVALRGACLHYGQSRFLDNLVVFCSRFGMALSGASLQQSSVTVGDNLLYVKGEGIAGGIDGISIEKNEIIGMGGRGTNDGIILRRDSGVFGSLPIDSAFMHRNTIRSIRGNAITILHRLGETAITSNSVREVGGGAVVMHTGAQAEYLRIERNRFEGLGRTFSSEKLPFYGLLIVGVQRSDISGNVISNVAGQAMGSPLRAAIAVMDCREMRVDGNRLFDIGPFQFINRTVGLLAAPGFSSMLISENSITREIATENNDMPAVSWQAIRIDGRPAGEKTEIQPVLLQYFEGVDSFELPRDRIVFISDERISLEQFSPALSLYGNYLRCMFSGIQTVQIAGTQSCLFDRNDIESRFGRGEGNIAGDVQSDHASVSNNRLVASKDRSFNLKVKAKKYSVLGNLKSGPIVVNGDSDTTLPPPWNTLNVQI